MTKKHTHTHIEYFVYTYGESVGKDICLVSEFFVGIEWNCSPKCQIAWTNKAHSLALERLEWFAIKEKVMKRSLV